MSIYKDYLGIEFKSKKKIPTHMFFKQKLPNHAKKFDFKIATDKTPIGKMRLMALENCFKISCQV